MIVRQNATIADIKNLIVLQVTRDLKEKGRNNKKISWYDIIICLNISIYTKYLILIIFHTLRKYIWKTYCLVFEGQKLLEDKARIQEIGIRSGCVLGFSRYQC
jgi:hypothetical protein